MSLGTTGAEGMAEPQQGGGRADLDLDGDGGHNWEVGGWELVVVGRSHWRSHCEAIALRGDCTAHSAQQLKNEMYRTAYLVTQLIGDGLRPVCRPIGDTIW